MLQSIHKQYNWTREKPFFQCKQTLSIFIHPFWQQFKHDCCLSAWFWIFVLKSTILAYIVQMIRLINDSWMIVDFYWNATNKFISCLEIHHIAFREVRKIELHLNHTACIFSSHRWTQLCEFTPSMSISLHAQKSHSALGHYPTMRQCICAHFCNKMVYCGRRDRCDKCSSMAWLLAVGMRNLYNWFYTRPTRMVSFYRCHAEGITLWQLHKIDHRITKMNSTTQNPYIFLSLAYMLKRI